MHYIVLEYGANICEWGLTVLTVGDQILMEDGASLVRGG